MRRIAAKTFISISFTAALMTNTVTALAEDSPEDLAKKLSNPIAALISVPFQGNYDHNIGLNDGKRYTLNIQPVIPISLNTNWNIISRTIVPLSSQNDIVLNTRQNGFGDVLQSLFFSPKAPTQNGWIWGAGPVFLFPTASDHLLGGEKWGIGPTIVILRQQNGWTYGALANHINSIAGDSDRSDICSSFLQPFLSYTTKTSTTFSLNSESTYDWKNAAWTVPINFSVGQLFKVCKQPMQLAFGVRYWAQTTDASPEGWAARITYTLLFPK